MSMGCWSAMFGCESGICVCFVGDLLILICFVSWSMYLTPGSEWTLVQSGLDNHVTTYAQACYKVEIVSNPGFLQSCHNLVTSLLQPVYNLCTTYIYNPSCTKVVTTWLQPCTFCMGLH